MNGEIVELIKSVKKMETMFYTEKSNENIYLFIEPEENLPINKPEGIELEDEGDSSSRPSTLSAVHFCYLEIKINPSSH